MLSEIFAERQIDGGVLRQIVSEIRRAGESIAEARAVVNIGGGIGAPRQRDVAAHIERVALVMIERSEFGRRRVIGKAAGNGATALGDLVGVGEVDLSAVGKARRAQCEFPGANQGFGNGDGKENVGRSNVVVIEKIGGLGFESIGIEDPSSVRDGNTELMFFVALAVERNDGNIVLLDVLQQRAGNGFDWRRLVIVSVESAECPAKLGDRDRGSEAWADGGFGNRLRRRGSRKVAFGEARGPHPGGECQPGKGVEFVVDVKSLEIGSGMFGIRGCEAGDDVKELVIALVKADESNLHIILLVVGGKSSLTSGVNGSPVLRRGLGSVRRLTGVVSAVVVEEGRNRRHEM